MWEHKVCDALTGRPLLTLQPSDWSWKTGKAPTTASSHTFRMKDNAGITEAMWDDFTEPWSRCLVSSWHGVPQYAGLVQDADVDLDAGVVTVQHDEFSRVLMKRLASGQDAFSRDGVFEVAGKSARSAISAIVQRATQGAPGYNFPVVGFIGHEPGPVTLRWPFVEFATARDMLDQIVNQDGAPDMYFRPRWSSLGWLEFVLEIGSPRLGGPVVEWVRGAPETPVLGLKVRKIGSEVLTGVIGVGQGTGRDTVIGFAGGLGTFPVRLDATKQFKSVSDAAVLDRLAMGELRPVERPVKQVSITKAPVGVLPNVRVGSGIRLRDIPNGFIGGTTTLEVVGVSSTPGGFIGLETQ